MMQARAGIAAVLAAAVLAGCAAPASDARDQRMALEHDLAVLSDQYGETLTELRRYEQLNLDARTAAATKRADELAAEAASADAALAGLDRRQRALLEQVDLPGSTTQPAGSRDLATEMASLKLLKSESELRRVEVQQKRAKLEIERSELRQWSAQRDILDRRRLVQEKRLLELNRKLK